MTSDRSSIQEAFAPAKINLTLHVTGQRGDGYHVLDSLVLFANVGDRLWLNPDKALSIAVSGPFAQGVPTDETNLVWRAAELANWTGHIHLEKNLPHGAGIGGGSSDAAAVLRLCAGGIASAQQQTSAVKSLGADVPVCFHGAAQRMRGIGEVLSPLPDFPPLWAVLVNSGAIVPTPPVFKALVQKQNPPMPEILPTFGSAQEVAHWLTQMRNDLEEPAISVAPEIKTVLSLLADTDGALMTRMSGSGATCFALYDGQEQAVTAAHQLAMAKPNWWAKSCLLS